MNSFLKNTYYWYCAFIFRSGSVVVVAFLQLGDYKSPEEFSRVLYDISVATSNSQLGGQNNTEATIIAEIHGTNHTGK